MAELDDLLIFIDLIRLYGLYMGVGKSLFINLLTCIHAPCVQLDDQAPSNCEAKKVSYLGLRDGSHTFEVCANGSRGIGCASYNWTVG